MRTYRILGPVTAFALITYILVVLYGGETWLPNSFRELIGLPKPSVALVVASTSWEDVSWAVDGFPDWETVVYVVDDPKAEHTVPVNKGREVMVYLSYLIDHYDTLPDIVIFSHADRYQWHNDDPLYDGQRVLAHLQLPYVQKQGYVSLRCDWFISCPTGLYLTKEAQAPEHQLTWNTSAEYFIKEAFEELFPGEPSPKELAAPCCAQFAVTRKQIVRRSREEYEHMRNWMLHTERTDDITGRVFEYSWHVIFGKEPIHCPNVAECYCKAFGLCNLDCDVEFGSCAWYSPQFFADFSKGWPDVDLDGKWRNITELRIEQEKAYSTGIGIIE